MKFEHLFCRTSANGCFWFLQAFTLDRDTHTLSGIFKYAIMDIQRDNKKNYEKLINNIGKKNK